MQPFHLIFGASLAAHCLVGAGYVYTRHELQRVDAGVAVSGIVAELALTPEQAEQLGAMRRALRAGLRPLRAEGSVLFEAALARIREARPGDTSYEAALLATGEVRRRQTLVITRELIAFREHLTPAQCEVYNRHIGEWAFIEVLIGLVPESGKSPPSGPFRGSAPPRAKDGG